MPRDRIYTAVLIAAVAIGILSGCGDHSAQQAKTAPKGSFAGSMLHSEAVGQASQSQEEVLDQEQREEPGVKQADVLEQEATDMNDKGQQKDLDVQEQELEIGQVRTDQKKAQPDQQAKRLEAGVAASGDGATGSGEAEAPAAQPFKVDESKEQEVKDSKGDQEAKQIEGSQVVKDKVQSQSKEQATMAAKESPAKLQPKESALVQTLAEPKKQEPEAPKVSAKGHKIITWSQFFDNELQETPSDRFWDLSEQRRTVTIKGYMGEILSMEKRWFLLIPSPGAECPFDNGDETYWNKIMIVYVPEDVKLRYTSGPLEVTGRLDVGVKVDESGYKTMFRLYQAEFEKLKE